MQTQERREEILRWDLTDVRRKFEQKHPEFDAERTEREWKRYMILLYEHPETVFPISGPVDEFAHTHMIFLGNFRNLERRFGHMDHTPTFSLREQEELLPAYLGTTLPTYQQTFGEEPPHDLWPRHECLCGYNGQSGDGGPR